MLMRSKQVEDALAAVVDEMKTIGQISQKTSQAVLYHEVLRLEHELHKTTTSLLELKHAVLQALQQAESKV